MTTAFAYARHSADRSDPAAIGQVAEQLCRINAYASEHGYRIVATFEDYCPAGAEDRPGFDALLGALDYSLAATLIAIDETRFDCNGSRLNSFGSSSCRAKRTSVC